MGMLTKTLQNVDISDLVSEREKNSEAYLQTMTDSTIRELVIEKHEIRKAFRYYNGFLEEEHYRHIEENYGIGNPTCVEFIPLIRRHIDVLVGEQLRNNLNPKITCRDADTIRQTEEMKMRHIMSKIYSDLSEQFQENLQYVMLSDEEKEAKSPPVDKLTKAKLDKLIETQGRSFKSEFETVAQNVLNHFISDRYTDMKSKLKTLFTDMLISGSCYYRVFIRRLGETPRVRDIKSIRCFLLKKCKC